MAERTAPTHVRLCSVAIAGFPYGFLTAHIPAPRTDETIFWLGNLAAPYLLIAFVPGSWRSGLLRPLLPAPRGQRPRSPASGTVTREAFSGQSLGIDVGECGSSAAVESDARWRPLTTQNVRTTTPAPGKIHGGIRTDNTAQTIATCQLTAPPRHADAMRSGAPATATNDDNCTRSWPDSYPGRLTQKVSLIEGPSRQFQWHRRRVRYRGRLLRGQRATRRSRPRWTGEAGLCENPQHN
jgi:hypothetical protein